MNTQQVYSILLLEFPYFKKLDLTKRDLMCKRILEFIKHTRFVGKQKLEVTDKMKILIAACSQQLTLSFKKNYLYDHFDRIFIYPNKYLSTVTKNYHVGEMNTAGLVIFSWEDFHEGIKVENDNRNVGLHEFAHALEFIDIVNKPTDDRFSFALDKEFMVAQDFIKTRPEEQFFRNYAMTNRAEFFAVATEYFFESPEDFYAAHPVTYELFCKIYGQDMREKTLTFKPFESKQISFLGNKVYDPFFILKKSVLINIASLCFFLYLLDNIIETEMVFYKGFFLVLSLLTNFVTSFYYTSFGIYENGIIIHHGFWRRIIQSVIFSSENKSTIISYDNIFLGNINGKYDWATFNLFLFIFQQINSIPRLTLRYYSGGKIKKSSISLLTFSYEQKILQRLYLEKKICIRVDGQIKRFD